MTGRPGRTIRFPDFELRLTLDDEELAGAPDERFLAPLSRRLLCYLIDNRDRIVPRDELLREVWRDVHVNEASLRQALRVLRREVGREIGEKLVESVRGRGVRLGVRVVEESAAARDPMVGRDAELDFLLADAETVRQGGGRFVLVSGPAGIGKTRLLGEFTERMTRRGFHAKLVRCGDARHTPVLWAWEQILRGVLDDDRDVLRQLPSPDAETLRRALVFLGTARDEGLDPVAARLRLFEAIRQLLAKSAQKRPLMLVFDDFEQMDATSLELLEWMAARIDRLPVLLCSAHREPATKARDGFGTALGHLVRCSVARELRLAPLSRDSVVELVRSAFPYASEATRDEVWRRSGGNAFFLRIALREAREHWDRGGTPSMLDGVREAALEPLAVLSDETRDLLTAAAVLGMELRFDVLGLLVERPPTAVERGISEARRAGLLREYGPGRLGFVHALVVEALCDSLDAEARTRLNARIVAILEQRVGTAASTVAEHALRARTVLGDEAVSEWCIRAAQESEAALAFEEAARFLEHALALSEDGDPRRRLSLLVALAEARARVAGAPGVETPASRAISLARALGDGRAMSRAVLAMGGARGVVDDRPDPQWISQLEEAVAVHQEPTAERARLLCSLADSLWFTPALARARTLASESVALARAIDDTDTTARTAIAAFRISNTGTGVTTVQRDFARSIEKVIAEVQDRLIALEGGVTLMWQALMEGDAGGVAQWAARVTQEASAVGGPHSEWWSSVSLASLAHLRGDFEEAERQAQHGLARGQEAGIAATSTNHALQMFSIRRDQGRLGELEAFVAQRAQRNPENVAWLVAWRLAQVEAGKPGPARELLRSLGARGVATLPEHVGRVPALVMLADLAVSLGDVEIAVAVREQLDTMRRQHAVVALGFCHWGSLARHLGRMEAVSGELDAAIASLEDGIARDRKLGAVACVARGQIELGGFLERRNTGNDRARGTALRREGAALARDLGIRCA